MVRRDRSVKFWIHLHLRIPDMRNTTRHRGEVGLDDSRTTGSLASTIPDVVVLQVSLGGIRRSGYRWRSCRRGPTRHRGNAGELELAEEVAVHRHAFSGGAEAPDAERGMRDCERSKR